MSDDIVDEITAIYGPMDYPSSKAGQALYRARAEIESLRTRMAELEAVLGQSYRLNSELEAALRRLGGAPMRLNTAAHHGDLCSDCPPIGYPSDVTRCSPCPRRIAALPAISEIDR